MTQRLIGIVCLVVVSLFAATSLVRAQGIDDRSPRIAANLALGLAGELDTYVGDAHFDADLDPSVGFDLRGELPVLDFLVIGAWFEFMGTLVDAPDMEREESLGFDVYVRGRWVFEAVADTFFIEPYVLLPIGLTLGILPDDDGSGDDIFVGWNTAALFGAQFLHASGFGGYLELGWRHAEVYHDQTVVLLGTRQVSLVVNEMALNIGFVYAFGGAS